MNISGYIKMAQNMMILLLAKRLRFRELMCRADLYAYDQSDKMMIEEKVMFNYNGKDLEIVGYACIQEVFFKEVYQRMKVKGKTVIDVGCFNGDTAIYFMLNGATNVIGYDIEEHRLEQARSNCKRNGIENTEFHLKEVKSIGDIEHPPGSCLKMDCEGAEYDFIKNASEQELHWFDEIILEYHRDRGGSPDMILDKLNKSGFVAVIVEDESGTGIIHASRCET